MSGSTSRPWAGQGRGKSRLIPEDAAGLRARTDLIGAGRMGRRTWRAARIYRAGHTG